MNTSPVIGFWNLGPVEIFVILLVALLLFGRRLPEVARSLGQGMVEFRKGLRDQPDEPRPLPDQPKADAEEAHPSGEAAGYDVDSAEESGSEPKKDDLAG